MAYFDYRIEIAHSEGNVQIGRMKSSSIKLCPQFDRDEPEMNNIDGENLTLKNMSFHDRLRRVQLGHGFTMFYCLSLYIDELILPDTIKVVVCPKETHIHYFHERFVENGKDRILRMVDISDVIEAQITNDIPNLHMLLPEEIDRYMYEKLMKKESDDR